MSNTKQSSLTTYEFSTTLQLAATRQEPDHFNLDFQLLLIYKQSLTKTVYHRNFGRIFKDFGVSATSTQPQWWQHLSTISHNINDRNGDETTIATAILNLVTRTAGIAEGTNFTSTVMSSTLYIIRIKLMATSYLIPNPFLNHNHCKKKSKLYPKTQKERPTYRCIESRVSTKLPNSISSSPILVQAIPRRRIIPNKSLSVDQSGNGFMSRIANRVQWCLGINPGRVDGKRRRRRRRRGVRVLRVRGVIGRRI